MMFADSISARHLRPDQRKPSRVSVVPELEGHIDPFADDSAAASEHRGTHAKARHYSLQKKGTMSVTCISGRRLNGVVSMKTIESK